MFVILKRRETNGKKVILYVMSNKVKFKIEEIVK